MHSACVHPLLLPAALGTFSRNLSCRKIGFAQRSKPMKLFLTLKRDAYDKNQDGRVVDENMIVLRMRIHDMKMAESNEDRNVSDDQQSYSSDITNGIGMLQVMLMETRPSLVLGMLAFVLLSVVTSMVAIALVLTDMVKVATL